MPMVSPKNGFWLFDHKHLTPLVKKEYKSSGKDFPDFAAYANEKLAEHIKKVKSNKQGTIVTGELVISAYHIKFRCEALGIAPNRPRVYATKVAPSKDAIAELKAELKAEVHSMLKDILSELKND